MDEMTKMMRLMGKGMWGGTKVMLKGMGSLMNHLGGNTPEKRNQRKKGIVEYKPSEIGGFFPPEESSVNTVISGGSDRIRAEAVGAFCQLALYHQMPVIVLHCADQALEQYMFNLLSGTGLLGVVNPLNPCYEPFAGKNPREISQMVVDSAPKDFEIKANLRIYLEGACAFLQAKGVRPNYHLLSTCPHGQLFLKVDQAVMAGKMGVDQGQEIKRRLMAGQNEYFKLENYFYDLDAQIGGILWKKQRAGQKYAPVNILRMLGNQGVLMIDVNAAANQLVINLMLAEIRMALQRGIHFACVLDSLEVSDNEYLKRLLEQSAGQFALAFSNRDVYAACNADDNLFNVVLGKSGKNIIFGHSSNVSATKWSEGIGYYDKEEVSRSFNKSKSYQPVQFFPTTTSGQSTNISIKREYILKPEEILRMQEREAYIYTKTNNEFAHTSLV